VEAEVRDKRPSQSKPDRGFLRMGYAVVNQRGETVLTFIITHMLARRPSDPAT
jgi:acyl dehydratase